MLNGNQTITEDTKYGKLTDCASSANDMATRMVIVKANGNYTINSDVTVEPNFNETYGGPKGFLLYVTGTLTNNGTINNNHGAYAKGEDVYLFKNANGNFEYVPSVGGLGGTELTTSAKNATVPGNPGQDGENRSTAGGGSGVAGHGDEPGTATSGKGGKGTSYSGGAGGGGVNLNVSYGTLTAGDGSDDGGAGGISV